MSGPAGAAERTGKAWIGPALVVGFLTLAVAANVTLVVLATSDPSFAVEEDYYEKALAYDQVIAQRDWNARLGWTAATRLQRAPGRPGAAQLVVTLTDADGTPLRGLDVSAESFHLARSAHPFRLRLEEVGEGSYRCEIPSDRPGLWEVRLEALARARPTDSQAPLRFTSTARVELPGVVAPAGDAR